MSEIKVDTIGPRVDNGTLTIGASGDTVNIAGTAGTGFPASPITAFTNGVDNRVVTATGSAGLNGEENLTFDGESLVVSGNPGTIISQRFGLTLENDTDSPTSGNSKTGIVFRSPYTGTTTTTAMGGISGGKDNATDGDYGGFVSLNTRTNGGAVMRERVRVDSIGAVTMPYQPAFFAYLNSDQSVSSSSRTTITVNAERWDNNADFNTGNYTFTAPVTGRYQFNVGEGLYNLASGQNGAAFLATSNRDYIFRGDVSANLYSFYGGSIIVDMDANDTALIQVQSQADTSYTVQGDYKTTFSGFLVC